jgi:magnesium-transporting ATPase (P-type)
MVPSSVPSWYTLSYESLARRGLRVLALAYKKVSLKDTPRPAEQPRAWVESQLHFGGFIAFECKIRADSGIVMQALIQSDHKVCMITGDGLLTSLHVAKKVNICSEKLPCLTLTVQQPASSEAVTKAGAAKHVWMLYDDTTGEETEVAFDPSAGAVAALGVKYNLLTTEEAFNSATAASGGKTSPLWAQAGTCQCAAVYAYCGNKMEFFCTCRDLVRFALLSICTSSPLLLTF